MSEIHNIFPIAIMEFKILCSPEDIQKKLEPYKPSMKDHPLLKGGGSSTYTPYDNILDKPEFAELKREFVQHLKEYKKLSGLKDFDFINSWFSIMNNNTSLKMHRHQASVVSGSYWPKCPEGSVGLTFKNPLEPNKMCELYSEVTEYNAVEAILPAREGYLCLFPSWLEHGTKINTTDERYVIAFNTMHVH
jgi:uncharacterized protein (TIGR02466 family)